MRFQVVPAAYVLLLREVGGRAQLLLQLRHNTGYFDEHWATAAAGHVEAGESAVEAAVREATEELVSRGDRAVRPRSAHRHASHRPQRSPDR